MISLFAWLVCGFIVAITIFIFENVLPSRFFKDSKNELSQKRWKIIRKKLQEIQSVLLQEDQNTISDKILNLNHKYLNFIEEVCNRQSKCKSGLRI